jgi:Tol biopolymer transport system component
MTILALLALIVLGGALAFAFYPGLSYRLLDLYPPIAAFFTTPTTEVVANPSPTQTVENAVVEESTLSPTAEVPAFTDTPTPTPTPTLEPTSTVTPTPTKTLSPTPTLSPTATPMGGGHGQIAFASNRSGLPQIWVVNADGTGLRQVTDTQQGACQPDWSPDGEQIVFISPCDNHREVYTGSSLFIINQDGTDLTPLPTVGGGDYDPSWSPDGEKIVFTSLREFGHPQLYLMDLEDRSVERVSDSDYWDLQASWSVDGKQIIFISTRNGPYQIWIMEADGSLPIRFSLSGGRKNTYPDWSPDGQVIVYTQSETDGAIPRLFGARYPDGAAFEFRVYPFAGNIPMRKAEHSPDGFWLVFESWPDGVNHDIFVMTPNGAERTQITSDPALDFDPTWRPILP